MPKTDEGKWTRVYSLLDEIRERLARLETLSPERKEELDGIDDRLREIEIVVHKQMGASAIIGGILGIVGGVVTSLVVFFITKGGSQ